MTRRKQMLQQLDNDIREHIERETQDNIDRGMSPEEARYAAVRKFGNVTRVKEDTRAVWTLSWLDDLLQDVRYGLRLLRNAPAFTAVAVLTLALGIGANTAIFSLIDAVMLRALPVDKPSQLVLFKWSARNQPRIHGYVSSGNCPTDMHFTGANPAGCSFSEPMFREIANASQFSGVAAFANAGPLSLTGNGPASLINGQLVSGDFFRTLGVRAAAGRVLEMSDDSPKASLVAVLSYGYWQSAFGGSHEVLGKTIELNGVAFTIVGVAEQRFSGLAPGSDFDVWLPLAAGSRITNTMMWSHRDDNPSFWWLTMVARLKPGSPLAQTQGAVNGIFRNEMLYGSVPQFDAGGPIAAPGGRPGAAPASGERVVIGGPPAAGQRAESPQADGANGGRRVLRPISPATTRQHSPNAAAPPRPGSQAHLPDEPAIQATTASLSKPDDEPIITLLDAHSGLMGLRERFGNPLYVLMSAVGIILLIACSNVAGLMLVRAAARQKEMALRLALGAGRVRIVRQLLTESVILAVAGGLLGILLASWGAHTIVSFVSSNQPRPLAVATGLDWRILGFTIGVSLLTGILFGLAPAMRGTRMDLTPALKEGTGISARVAHRLGRRFSMGNALVVTQVALAVVVLVGAGLLVQTLRNLRSVDVGFDSRNIVIFGINPMLAGYRDTQIDSFYRDLQSRLNAIPGVRSASYSMVPLLSGFLLGTSFHWPGTPQDRESESDMLPIGPDFFSAMHIPFIGGRSFNSTDYGLAARRPAVVPTPVVVNQAFIAKYAGKENPLGKRFGESPASDEGPASPGYEIVGVVRDTKYGELRREIKPIMYTPLTGFPASFEVRTASDPQAQIPMIRNVVAEMDPNLPLRDITTESLQIDRLLFQERLIARLSSFFGLLALLLACIGLYGLLAYEVARRTREIGTRMALGAERADVLGLVLKQGLALAAFGAVAGIGVALGLTRYLKAMLYDVRPYDPITMVAVAALLLAVALAACFIPARRATSVDPIVALRYE